MSIALAVSGMPLRVIDAETITIGSDPAATVVLAGDDRIRPRHAVIRKVAGRWMVEARDADSVRVGDLDPARLHWLSAGDVIEVVENGPKIVFQPGDAPSGDSAASAPAAQVPELRSGQEDEDSLFAPLTEPIRAPSSGQAAPAPRGRSDSGTVRAHASPAAPHAAQSNPTRPGRSPHKKNRREKSDPEQPTAGDDRVLRRGSLGNIETPSGNALGWTIVWVAVGLVIILAATCIWLGSSDTNIDDTRPAAGSIR